MIRPANLRQAGNISVGVIILVFDQDVSLLFDFSAGRLRVFCDDL